MNPRYGHVLLASGFGSYLVLTGVSWLSPYGVKKYNLSLTKDKGLKLLIRKFMSYGPTVYIVPHRAHKASLNMDDNTQGSRRVALRTL